MKYRQRKQLRAKRLIRTVAAVCIIIVLAMGGSQIALHGFHNFTVRQNGIGASPGEIDCPGQNNPPDPVHCPKKLDVDGPP